jgi:hypothetical protein
MSRTAIPDRKAIAHPSEMRVTSFPAITLGGRRLSSDAACIEEAFQAKLAILATDTADESAYRAVRTQEKSSAHPL